jgi:hypothetical protein
MPQYLSPLLQGRRDNQPPILSMLFYLPCLGHAQARQQINYKLDRDLYLILLRSLDLKRTLLQTYSSIGQLVYFEG